MSQYVYGKGSVQLHVSLVDPPVAGWTVPRKVKVDLYRVGWIATTISDMYYTATDLIIDGMRECVSTSGGERIRIDEKLYQRLRAKVEPAVVKQVGQITITT